MAKKIEIKGPIVSDTSGWLYDWLGLVAAYPKALQNALEEAGGEDVILEINSNGGLATSGFEMYKLVKDYPGKVTVHLINAMSAASLIVCAADEALASDAAIFMIHNTRCSAEGDYRDMQKEENALKEFNKSIINVYMRKTGISQEKLQEMMDSDTYMSPQKAIEYGFVDGYLYGDMEEDNSASKSQNMVVTNAISPIIAEDKANAIMNMLKGEKFAEKIHEIVGQDEKNAENPNLPAITKNEEIGFMKTDSNKIEGGAKKMTLEEFLAENPDAKVELADKMNAAKEEGGLAERQRLKELDEIFHSINPDVLSEAKYGEKTLDAKELAYQVMKDDKEKMSSYMTDTLSDSMEAKVDDVGVGEQEGGVDDADIMANHVNKKKGGKK